MQSFYDLENIDSIHCKRAIDHLARLALDGNLIAFPTETVYGIGGIVNEDTIESLYHLKQREKSLALTLLLHDAVNLDLLAVDIPKAFFLLKDAFMPGSITIILKKHDLVPTYLTGGKNTVAIRYPSNPVSISLLREIKRPIFATSANLSKQAPLQSGKEVLDQFGSGLAGIVSKDSEVKGIPSTIISLEDPSHPIIIREGAISQIEINGVLRSLDLSVDILE